MRATLLIDFKSVFQEFNANLDAQSASGAKAAAKSATALISLLATPSQETAYVLEAGKGLNATDRAGKNTMERVADNVVLKQRE